VTLPPFVMRCHDVVPKHNENFAAVSLLYTTKTEASIKAKAVKIPATAMQRQRREEYSSFQLLTLALCMGQWSASSPDRALPPERTPGTHWIGRWVDLRTGLDAEATEKILCICKGSDPSRPVCSQTLY
jgi:hypothetical protein